MHPEGVSLTYTRDAILSPLDVPIGASVVVACTVSLAVTLIVDVPHIRARSSSSAAATYRIWVSRAMIWCSARTTIACPPWTLLRTGRIALLRDLFGEVSIPSAVARELDRATRLQGWRTIAPFLLIHPVSDQRLLSYLLREVDPGEAECIVLALEHKASLLLLDESDGRAVAARHGIPVLGLVGVVIEAKRRGQIQSAEEVLRELRTIGGAWLEEAFILRILQRLGER